MGLFGKDRDLTQAPDRVELHVDASALRVKADEVAVRLDHFLTQHLQWRSRNSIQALIRDGYVLVDPATPDAPHGCGEAKQEKRAGRKLRHGSRVVVMIPEELRIVPVDAASDPIVVLYEDDEVVVVDKPPDLAVHPSGRHLSNTLIQRIHHHFRDEIEAGAMVPRLCHRLDRETSGVVLIGKHPLTHPHLMRQFEERSVEKEYLAIVHGAMEESSGSIEFSMAPSRTSSIRLKMAVMGDGLEARTDWRVLESSESYTLAACQLFTGRQHQIRLHLATIGHPIVGDKLYIDEEMFQKHADGCLADDDLRTLQMPRHALHNHRLVFRTPVDGTRVEAMSPMPADMREFLERNGLG
ncbi:MAG: 23S rRNA pseudouridine1911/1915/1917 synthase [Chlamydiales bacterium]|jgi:23S rRNA pseudouridine1911/1915/1917 synthase